MYTWKKFTRKQIVYQENKPANCFYVVVKGHFQLERVLPQKSGLKSQQADSMMQRNQLTKNILQYRLPELSDFPQNHKLRIYGTGSMVGEEDVIKQRPYSATLKCISEKGTIIEIPMKCLALLLETDE